MTPESSTRGAHLNPKTPRDNSSETRSLRNVSPDELGSLAALATISEMVNASYDTDDVLRRIMDLVIETMGAERGFVMLDHGGEQPEIAVARGISMDTSGSEESWYSKTVVQQVLSRGEPVLSVDAVRDSRFSSSQSLRLLHTRSVLCVPMRTRQQNLGVIYIDSLTTAGVFTTADRDVLKIIADLAAAAIERAQYFGHMIQSEKMAALGTLVAGVAHELNNPLACIMGFAELLTRRVGDGESLEMVQMIHREAGRCGKMIREMLSLSRRDKMTLHPVDVKAVVDKTLPLLVPEFNRDSVELMVDIPEGMPRIHGNADQLQQVLLNLLTNARLALRGREDARVGLRTIGQETRLIIQVTDNGPGVAPEHMRKIFDPFFTTRAEGQGTGLGLSIVQRIIAEHRGTIEVRNNPTAGVCFTITFPIANGVR